MNVNQTQKLKQITRYAIRNTKNKIQENTKNTKITTF